MTRHNKTLALLTVIFAMAVSLTKAQVLEGPAEGNPNKVSISGRFGFNISASFEGLGGFTAQTDPGLANRNADHFYDDGYNRMDGRAVSDGLTWFWGHSNASQTPGNGTIVMNSSSSPSDRSISGFNNDPQLGLEIRYGRDIGKLGRASWGVETAFGYHQLEFKNSRTIEGTLVRLSDAYGWSGAIPPEPPHSGTAAGPGTLIGDTPTRTVTTNPSGAIVAGRRDLDASLFGFKLGPNLEIPITKRFSASINAGLAAVHVDSDFAFTETVTVPSMGPALQPGVSKMQSRAGSGSHTDWLVGGFAGARINFLLTERSALFAGCDYQNVGTFSQTVRGKHAEINLGEAVFLSAGVSFKF